MFDTVTQLGVPYILTDAQSTNMKDMMLYFASKVQQLRDLGQKDIILDPGYGFGKTLEENYLLLNQQEMLTIFELPLLVGVSRKSMIYRLLDCTPNEALNGTTVLNTIALTKGTNILRVHDVKAAVEVVSIIQKLQTAPTLNP
jgi:dihydropteroate synthase